MEELNKEIVSEVVKSPVQDDVLLKVDNLCQYFKMGRQQLKAVDHVSFEIKKGEVFGLVGESGCGKTTTGRSIIKLYDITGGDVYFKGRRICAGALSYKEAIAKAKKHCLEQINALKGELASDSFHLLTQHDQQESHILI